MHEAALVIIWDWTLFNTRQLIWKWLADETRKLKLYKSIRNQLKCNFQNVSNSILAKLVQFLYLFSGMCIPFHKGLLIFIEGEGALPHLLGCLWNKRGSTAAQGTYLQHTVFVRNMHNSPNFCIFNDMPLLFINAFNYSVSYFLFLFLSFCIFISYCSDLSKLLPSWLCLLL